MGADTRTYLCNPFLYQHVLLLKISQRSHSLAQCSNRTPELAHNIGSELDWISFTIGGIIIWIILMLLYFSMFKYIWLILGAPVFTF